MITADTPTEELAQRYSEGWARRIVACPRVGCRRHQTCVLGGHRCPALEADPFSDEHVRVAVVVLRRMISARYHDSETGPEALAAGDARRKRDYLRRRALAFQRAREEKRVGKG